MEAALRHRFENWRGLLRRNVTEARPVLEVLLGGRIVVAPLEPHSPASFDVRVPLTVCGIYEGICFPIGQPIPGARWLGSSCRVAWSLQRGLLPLVPVKRRHVLAGHLRSMQQARWALDREQERLYADLATLD